MKWTEEQWQAINQEGSNIIVSAGAGSGKTAVLSERVLRKVKEGVDIRDILILTFTNEAAGEMKNRIRKKITDAGELESLEFIDAASITTFDAYAFGLVKKYHYLLNISKQVSIIDSSIIDLEKKRILKEIFAEYYDKKDEHFLKLIGDFTTRDDEMIEEAILSINARLDLKYDKKEYLNSYLSTFYQEEYLEQLFREYFEVLKSKCSMLENLLYLLEDMIDEGLYQKLYDAYSVFFNPKKYDDLWKIKDVPKVQFRNIPEEAIPLKEEFKALVEEILNFSKYSESELKEQLRITKEYVQVIIDVILALDERLEKYKFQHEAFEFVDIAKMAIHLVKEHPSIREELKNSYNEILIDEYQDTNDLQELFISEIENNNVYMVGDIKQSIYRFRNANPQIFKKKYDDYTKHHGGEKIDLLKNFRSREEVLENINMIFNFLMSEDCGGVSYQGSHEMIFGNKAYLDDGATSDNHHMEILTYSYEDKTFSYAEVEAFALAKDILSKVKDHYQVYDFDLKAKRNIEYRDFCIILDRGTDMPTYKKIFEYFNIPMDVYQDSNLVSSNDLLIIKNIISLIIHIKNKEYDTKMRYYFVSIARSFIGNLSDQEILAFIHSNTFYDSEIYQTCLQLSKDLEVKTAGILLHEIIEAFHFYGKLIQVGNVSTGIKRIAYLYDLASNAEELGFTIIDFRDYLDNMITNKKEIRYKEERGIGNCVRLMNIHQSKGLEFPVCYFAGFWRSFNLKDLQSNFLFDSKYGILTPYFKEGIGVTLTKALVKNQYYRDEISEKIRLFYVALTRAKEKMIMIMPEFKHPMRQKGGVDSSTASKYRSFFDFMESIALNLKDYTREISLSDIGLTKDYELPLNKIQLEGKEEAKKIDFQELNVNSKVIQNKHASKVIQKILTSEEAEVLAFGTKMHEKLEMTDFKKDNVSSKYVQQLKNTFDFEQATIYQELEFYFTKDNTEYHGIIDLMLEYPDEIKIVDYKLKNIDDEAYIKQLTVYYDYVSSVSDKKISLYLYSILDNRIKEIEVVKN